MQLRHAAVAVAISILAGCAQTPPAAPPSATSVEAQRRTVFQVYVRQMLADDAFYERVLGVSRGVPNFAAAKQGLGAIYTDPVVLEWMTDQFERGVPQEQFVASVGQRLFAGIDRLDDATALTLFDSIGGMMGRLDRTQCDEFLRPAASGGKGSFARMSTWMTPKEVVDLFGVFRTSMRADILGSPLRTVPSGPNMARVVAALEGGSARGATENSCQRSARVMRTVATLPAADRSSGITFVLSMLGIGAQQAIRNQPAPAKPRRAEAQATPV